jgi:glycosyltransferase involved in cell wall biosynthesis
MASTHRIDNLRPPRVSVIIASYNHERYVAECLESVLAQSYQDFEIVVTDDGSADGTVERIQAIRDPRIRLNVFPKNRGACVAMNDCLARARGEYIAVLNSDDTFDPEKLAVQVQWLDRHPRFGAVFALPVMMNERGESFDDDSHKDYRIFEVDNRSRAAWLRHFFYYGNCLCHPTVLIRRACYERVGRYDPRLAQVPDLDMWIRLCAEYEIHVLPERLTRFRVRENLQNASAARPEVLVRDDWERQYLLEHYRRLEPGLFREAFASDLKALALPEDAPQPLVLARLSFAAGLPHHIRFGLDLLYRQLGTGDMPPPGYPDFAEFIRETGAHDPYGLLERAALQAQVKDLSARLDALSR